ncbi:hypothetical protein T02_12403 [Trichinella nativa]|uniref:Uncharacterized protein n=1 Tax=Trichinella nativa TaxID=6335 RepID=A0A0V1KW85_9BILA|nr:hypothetical protein T02_12403 [Trichinella nativa]
MISTRSRSFAEFSKSDKFRAYYRNKQTHQLTIPLYLKKLIMHAVCNKIFCMLYDIHYFGTKDFSDKQFADKC